MDTDLKAYLSPLVEQLSTRDAAEAFGYERNSAPAFSNLCRKYGVEIPQRANQHTPTAPTVSPVTGHRVRSQRAIPATRKKVGVEKCLVVSDIHVPFHDVRALGVALAIAEDVQPEVVVFNGDIADFYAVSRFDKNPHRALMLQDEIDETHEVLSSFRKVCPKAKMVYVEGNHEARMRNYLVSRAPELSGLDALDIRRLLGLDKLDIEYVPSKGKSAYWRYGAITIGHFDRVSKHSCFTEKSLCDDRRESLIQGHTHRTGDYFKRLPSGERIAGIGSGCLCELDPEYCTDPDWHHAVVLITKRKDTNRFHVEPVQIVDYEALYNDVLYSG